MLDEYINNKCHITGQNGLIFSDRGESFEKTQYSISFAKWNLFLRNILKNNYGNFLKMWFAKQFINSPIIL